MLALLFCTPAWAQQSAPGKDPLASKEEIVRDRMAQLEDRMFRLIEKLAETEPDQAERLRAALKTSRELMIRGHIDEVVKLLDEKNLTEASDRQNALVRDLNSVLKLLMENSVDLQEKQKEAEALKALRDRVARLIAEEIQHRQASRQAGEQTDLLHRLEDAARQIESLIERERTAAERTDAALKAGAGDAPAMAAAQAGIRGDTEKVAEELGRPASTQPGPAASRPAGTPQSTQPAAEMAREHMQRAAAQMKDAETPLGQGQFEKAKAGQQRSIESLRKALDEIRQQAEKLQGQLDLPRMADAQRDTASKTGKLAGDMADQSADKPTSRPGDSQGRPKGAQEGGQPKSPAPGRDNVQRAQQQMERAADDLNNRKPGDAGARQQEALEQLSQAMRQLEEQLNQLRREQQEEVLRALEDRFREMLARQLQINQNTSDLDKKGVSAWMRTDELLAGTLAQGERDLAGDATKALNILREEGTTLVFPQVVEQLVADFNDAGARIAAKDVAAATQQLQADIVETLKELVDAVEQMRKKVQSGQGTPDSGQQQTPPLLPDSAELKLLRSCQQRVNRQTELLNKERGTVQTLTPDQQSRLQRIAERQKDVATMAQELNERAAKR